jgi:hypothetical protein
LRDLLFNGGRTSVGGSGSEARFHPTRLKHMGFPTRPLIKRAEHRGGREREGRDNHSWKSYKVSFWTAELSPVWRVTEVRPQEASGALLTRSSGGKSSSGRTLCRCAESSCCKRYRICTKVSGQAGIRAYGYSYKEPSVQYKEQSTAGTGRGGVCCGDNRAW